MMGLVALQERGRRGDASGLLPSLPPSPSPAHSEKRSCEDLMSDKPGRRVFILALRADRTVRISVV